MKDKVLVFGGTTEGRILSQKLREAGVPHVVSVATEYGLQILKDSGEESIVKGRKDAVEIAGLISEGKFTVVVDSTHPFATAVSKEIRSACQITGAEYIRLKRDTSAFSDLYQGLSYVDDLKEATELLEKEKGNILLLTGSRDLQKITSFLSDISRVYVRVLPDMESLKKCEAAGLKGRQIIAMQGPFSTQMNEALIKEINASVILTKESGRIGGLDEKLEAARNCGVKTIVLRNPESGVDDSSYFTLGEVLQRLADTSCIGIEESSSDEAVKSNQGRICSDDTVCCMHGKSTGEDGRITIAGIGPGNPECFTRELEEALKSADIIFGAASVIDAFRGASDLYGNISKDENILIATPLISVYKGDEILNFLKENQKYVSPLVLYSGDVSLCSGAKKAAEVFRNAGYEVRIISGISSVNLFAKKLGTGLEDVKILSAHGRKCNVRGHVERNEHTIILPSNCEHAQELCNSLKHVADKIVVGYELGNPKEQVFSYWTIMDHNEKDSCVSEEDFLTEDNFAQKLSSFDKNKSIQRCTSWSELPGRCLIYAHNEKARAFAPASGLRDDEILRGNVPMTKEEIRALSMRKLALTRDAVLYDIGAGTGSVSLEAAILSPEIQVYSIEKNLDALELLQKNKEHFGADNMEIVSGRAPDALKELPAPTHVFVSGSGGNLKEILLAVFEKNENARIVINAVTAETFKETMSFIEEETGITSDVIQVFVSRYREVGKYHMADAINPVYIITISKGEKSE